MPPEHLTNGTTRRRALKTLGLGAVSAFSLPGVSAPVVAQSREDLLPAEEAVADPIQKKKTNIDGTATADGDVTADEEGSLSLEMDGVLDGSGQFGFSASPHLETAWTAPEDGLYRVEAEYTVDTSLNQNPYSDDITELATTLLSNSGVMDPSLTVVRDRSRREWGVRNRPYAEKGLETLLTFLAKRLIPSTMGPLGTAVARLILGLVFDQMIDSTTLKLDRELTTVVSSDFKAEGGQTYGIRFAPVAGVSGRSEENDAGFDASVSAEYDLQRFVLKPISGLQEHELAIYPAGDGATYRFESTKSLRGGSDLEPDFDPTHRDGQPDEVRTDTPLFGDGDPVRKASGAVGKRDGDDVDIYYFTGEIRNLRLTGSAMCYIDGERWFPFGGGPEEHELEIVPSSDGATYRFEVSGCLRGGSNMEPDFDPTHRDGQPDEVRTDTPLFGDGNPVRKASGAVGKRDGDDTDTYYYTGEITEWDHQGSTKMYIDGERWHPHA